MLAFTLRAIVPQLISIAITRVIRFYIAHTLVALLSRVSYVSWSVSLDIGKIIARRDRLFALMHAFVSLPRVVPFFPVSMIPSFATLAASALSLSLSLSLSVVSARVDVNVVIKLRVSRNVHPSRSVRASLSASSICRAQTHPSLLAAESILSTVFVF